MMTTKKSAAILAVATLGLASLTACSNASSSGNATPESTQTTPSPTRTTETPSPTPTPTPVSNMKYIGEFTTDDGYVYGLSVQFPTPLSYSIETSTAPPNYALVEIDDDPSNGNAVRVLVENKTPGDRVAPEIKVEAIPLWTAHPEYELCDDNAKITGSNLYDATCAWDWLTYNLREISNNDGIWRGAEGTKTEVGLLSVTTHDPYKWTSGSHATIAIKYNTEKFIYDSGVVEDALGHRNNAQPTYRKKAHYLVREEKAEEFAQKMANPEAYLIGINGGANLYYLNEDSTALASNKEFAKKYSKIVPVNE